MTGNDGAGRGNWGDHMDVLDFLKSIRHKRIELAAIKSYEDDLRLSLLPSGIRYDLDKVQTSPSDRMLEIMSKVGDISDRSDAFKASLLADIDLAERMVDAMPTSRYRTLLRLRYLYGTEPMSWQQVADALGVSIDHARGRMHGSAIAEIRMIWSMYEKDRPDK